MRNRIEIEGTVEKFETGEDDDMARFVLVWQKWPDGSHPVEIPVKIEDGNLAIEMKRNLGFRRTFIICGYLDDVSRWRSSEELGIVMVAFHVR